MKFPQPQNAQTANVDSEHLHLFTIEEYNKRFIIKRQKDTGSACNTKF